MKHYSVCDDAFSTKYKLHNIIMQTESIGDLECCKRIGKVEFREVETSTLSCLAAFLRWSGIAVKLDNLLDIAPVPSTGVSIQLLNFLAKRIGLRLHSVETDHIKSSLTQHPLLIQRISGYALLLLKLDGGGFIAALPGHPDSCCTIPFDSDILEEIAAVHALQLLPYGPARKMAPNPPKLWLLPWRPTYTASYDANAVLELKKVHPIEANREATAVPLGDLTIEALQLSHRSICSQQPDHYGRYRKINLRRGCIFVDFLAVPQATEELLARARESSAFGTDDAIKFAARLFTDFLSIHPFLNANRRMATLIVAKYLERWKVIICWKEINSSQIYYWTRCASHGHFRFLEEGFRRNLIDA